MILTLFNSSSDWSAPGQQQVVDTITGYINGPKTPGLVILEHTNSAITVGGFIQVFPLIASTGWTFRSVLEVVNDGAVYLNANSSTSNVTPMGILLPYSTTTSSSSTPPSNTFTSSIRRASPTSSTSVKSSARSWSRPSIFGLFLFVLLSYASSGLTS